MGKFIRRRDVRAKLDTIFELLASHLDTEFSDHGEYIGTFFDRPFLTQVRDLLRDGVSLEEALMLIDYEEKESAGEFEDYPGLRHHPECQDFQNFPVDPPIL